VSGGELFDRIIKKGYYTEEDAKKIVQDVLNAVAYLHSHKIVHRDLKPENLLLSDSSEEARVKLADFGLSTVVRSETLLDTNCGTLTYVVIMKVLRNAGA
jgi:serine/threonine protein kinase